MKIYGDNNSQFTIFEQEKGLFGLGHNDILNSNIPYTSTFGISFLKTPINEKKCTRKLYLHISNNFWSTFTGILRQYLLPWRWKTAYLSEDGKAPRKILVCTSKAGLLSKDFKAVIGKSPCLFEAIEHPHRYQTILGMEIIRIQNKDDFISTTLPHRLGRLFAVHTEATRDQLCPIYRPRSLFSAITYQYLKHCSKDWKEVAIGIGEIKEKILIKKMDEEALLKSGLNFVNS